MKYKKAKQKNLYRRDDRRPADEAAAHGADSEPDRERPARRKRRSKAPLFLALGAVLLLAAAALALFLPGGLLSSPLSRRDTVITLGEYKISADEYIYRFIGEKEEYEALDANYFASAENEKAFFKDAEQRLRGQYAILQWAKERGFERTPALEAAADDYIENAKTAFASEDAYRASLAENHLTEALYREMLINDLLLNSFAESVYGDAELSAVSDEQALAYAAENGAFAFRCILVTTSEGDGAAEKEALAKDIAAALQDDPAQFDAYAALYNEDPLAARYPDGFNMLPGELSSELEAAATALSEGEVSGAVLTESGWFILRRCALDPQAFHEAVVTARVEEKIAEYSAALSVNYGRGYHNMKIDEIAFAA